MTDGSWKEHILIVDLEELENLDAQEIYPRGIKAKEALSLKQMMQQNCE